MLASISIIIKYLRGDPSVTLAVAIKALLDLLSFGISQIPSGQMQALTEKPLTEKEAVKVFKEAVAAHQNTPHGAQPTITLPWAALLPVLAKWLADWIAGRKPAAKVVKPKTEVPAAPTEPA